jgi:hypothetical protein
VQEALVDDTYNDEQWWTTVTQFVPASTEHGRNAATLNGGRLEAVGLECVGERGYGSKEGAGKEIEKIPQRMPQDDPHEQQLDFSQIENR